MVDESSLARRLVHSQLASPGYSDVIEHIIFRLGMLFENNGLSGGNGSGNGNGSHSHCQAITTSLLSLLPSSVPSSANGSGSPSPDDVQVKVSVHGSAALHIVDSRLAVDLSVALTINQRSGFRSASGVGVGVVVAGGAGVHGDQKAGGGEPLSTLREAVVTAESLSALAPALHAEVRDETIA